MLKNESNGSTLNSANNGVGLKSIMKTPITTSTLPSNNSTVPLSTTGGSIIQKANTVTTPATNSQIVISQSITKTTMAQGTMATTSLQQLPSSDKITLDKKDIVNSKDSGKTTVDKEENEGELCVICGIRLFTLKSAMAHMTGIKHRKKQANIDKINAELKIKSVGGGKQKPAPSGQFTEEDVARLLYCSICKCEMNNVDSVPFHMAGKRHLKNVSLQKGDQQPNRFPRASGGPQEPSTASKTGPFQKRVETSGNKVSSVGRGATRGNNQNSRPGGASMGASFRGAATTSRGGLQTGKGGRGTTQLSRGGRGNAQGGRGGIQVGRGDRAGSQTTRGGRGGSQVGGGGRGGSQMGGGGRGGSQMGGGGRRGSQMGGDGRGGSQMGGGGRGGAYMGGGGRGGAYMGGGGRGGAYVGGGGLNTSGRGHGATGLSLGGMKRSLEDQSGGNMPLSFHSKPASGGSIQRQSGNQHMPAVNTNAFGGQIQNQNEQFSDYDMQQNSLLMSSNDNWQQKQPLESSLVTNPFRSRGSNDFQQHVPSNYNTTDYSQMNQYQEKSQTYDGFGDSSFGYYNPTSFNDTSYGQFSGYDQAQTHGGLQTEGTGMQMDSFHNFNINSQSGVNSSDQQNSWQNVQCAGYPGYN